MEAISLTATGTPDAEVAASLTDAGGALSGMDVAAAPRTSMASPAAPTAAAAAPSGPAGGAGAAGAAGGGSGARPKPRKGQAANILYIANLVAIYLPAAVCRRPARPPTTGGRCTCACTRTCQLLERA